MTMVVFKIPVILPGPLHVCLMLRCQLEAIPRAGDLITFDEGRSTFAVWSVQHRLAAGRMTPGRHVVHIFFGEADYAVFKEIDEHPPTPDEYLRWFGDWGFVPWTEGD